MTPSPQFSLAGRALADLGAQLQAERAKVTAIREAVRLLHGALMVAHDRQIHAEARAADPNYRSLSEVGLAPCDCQLCSWRAPVFDAYLGRRSAPEVPQHAPASGEDGQSPKIADSNGTSPPSGL